jgi:hypothetical protein
MRTGTLLAVILMQGACALRGGHRIDFSRLQAADRIQVIDALGQPFRTIEERMAIDEAIKFIGPYQSGWKDPGLGPIAPDFQLFFYQGERFLGAFGIAYRHIVSHSPVDGFWSREVPISELTRLSQTLGLPRPSVVEPKKD